MRLDIEHIESMELDDNDARNLMIIVESVLLGAFKSACDGDAQGYRFLNIVRNYLLENGVVDTRYMAHEIRDVGLDYVREKEKGFFREVIITVNSHQKFTYMDSAMLVKKALADEKLLENRVEHSINNMALTLYAAEKYNI